VTIAGIRRRRGRNCPAASAGWPRSRRQRSPHGRAGARSPWHWRPLRGARLLTSPAWIGRLCAPATADDAVIAQALSGHLRSLQPQPLMDVVSTDRHTVEPWFEGRLDFSPQVKDLASDGFPLAGGRLDVVGGRPVAALVYRRHLHVINLFQWRDDGAGPARLQAREQGYAAIEWSDQGMRYVAVSHVGEQELQRFVRDFREGAALR
jgi:anti-sigma factor RsiW